MIGGGGTFVWMYYGGFDGEQKEAVAFINTYGDYVEIAEHVEMLVHLPGTEGNVDRAELLTLLESILTKTMEPTQRDTLARLAFANVDTLKKEIDTAQIEQAKLYEVLQDLDTASRVFSSIDLHTRASEIVALARKRTEIAARITSVLSESNEQAQVIITRILADKGELTQEHITDINDTTDEAEKRFQTLEGLYNDLLEKKTEAEVRFTEFIKASL